MTDHLKEKNSLQATRVFIVWLVAVVLLLDLLVVTLALVSLSQSRVQYEERARVQAENLSQALESSIAGMIDTADVGLRGVVDEAERQLRRGGIDGPSLNSFIARQFTRLPELDSLRMADPHGDIVYGTGVFAGPVKTVTDRDYFLRLRNDPSEGLVISKPVVGRISGKWVVIIARRVNAPDGSFGGVVYGGIALERIGNVLASMDLGPHGGISLRDGDMAIIMRRPDTLGPAGAVGQKIMSPELKSRFEAGETRGTFYSEVGIDNHGKMVSYRQIDRYPLYIVVALASADFMAPWELDKYRISALVAVFVIVTLLLSRWSFVRWRSQKEAENALRRSMDELELRVCERTAELNEANEQLTRELAERQRAEVNLRQGRNMLAQIIDSIPQAVFWKDRDSVFLGCNMVFARTAGLDRPEQILGKTDYEMPWRDGSLAYVRDDREVMEERRPKFHIVEEVQQSDGSIMWVDTNKMPLCDGNGDVYGVLGIFENITERKAIEESRDKALALVETLLASSPTGIQVFDGKSGDCVIANEALADLVGGTREALLAQNLRRIKSWGDNGLTELAEEVLGDSGMQHRELSLTTTFGKSVDLDFFLSSFDFDGKPHLMCIVLNVTDRKQLEQEKRQMEAQMLHVQKLESLGVLAGGIAHDLNNILMVVIGNADLALSRLDPDSPLHDNLTQIENAASRAADLARQMLAYSGKGRFVIENLNMTAIVEEMAQMLEVSVSKKAALRYRFAQGLPAISGDATQLRQVILNLVINASEAIGDKSGTITISTSFMQCDRAYLSDSWIDDHLPEGAYVIMEVTDTGCGIEHDVIPRIFDPFFTTKFTGRGLGMAAVLGIVRGHNGAIRVYSEKGKGTIFRLLLPALMVAPDLPAPLPEPQTPWQGRGTILLVDDETSIRTLGEDMLQELGFRVLTAGNGREAVEIFGERRGEISCVLLDLTMPELDGEQTFRALRGIDAEVRVVISSGYNEQEVSERLFRDGLAGFIQKPYRLAEVSRKLQAVLG